MKSEAYSGNRVDSFQSELGELSVSDSRYNNQETKYLKGIEMPGGPQYKDMSFMTQNREGSCRFIDK